MRTSIRLKCGAFVSKGAVQGWMSRLEPSAFGWHCVVTEEGHTERVNTYARVETLIFRSTIGGKG